MTVAQRSVTARGCRLVKIGQKVTVRFLRTGPWGTRFLRCYVIRRLPAGWQLYDPVRDWSWGLNEKQAGERVIFGE